MNKLLLNLSACKNTSGQDLIEYALMAAFIAAPAGATLPGVASSISTIFSQVASALPADATAVSAATN